MRKKYLITSSTTMTYAKYLSLKSGNYKDYQKGDVETPIIGRHILYASVGDDQSIFEEKNIKHKENKKYYEKVFANKKNNIEIIDYNDEKLEEIFSDDNLIIIIPGIKTVKSVNKKTQYEIKKINDYEYLVIQMQEYTNFIKYVRKMPGTMAEKINNVESYEFGFGDECFKIQYLQNKYNSLKSEIDNISIDDFHDKLDENFKENFYIDLFVSHQSKDKNYIEEKIKQYRKNNPGALVWYDKDYFKVGIKSDSAYARNTIAHGILHSKEIVIVQSNNYFDKLLKNIEDPTAEYFGINYELSLISNLKEHSKSKLEKVKLYQYKHLNLKKDKIVFNYEYNELKNTLKTTDIPKNKFKKKLKNQVDLEKKTIEFLHRDL